MKLRVVANDQQCLALELIPAGQWLLAGLGGLLMLLGPVIVYLLGWVVSVDFHDGRLEHRQSLLRCCWHQRKSIPLNTIQSFETEVRRNAIAATMVVVVHTKSGATVDLPVGDMAGEEKEKLVQQFNAVIASQVDFNYSSDVGAAIVGCLILGGSLFVAGLVCLFYLQVVSINGDREAGNLCIAKRRRLTPWNKLSTQCIQIGDFSHVASEELLVRSSQGIATTSHFVSVVDNSGRRIPLAHGPMFTDASRGQIADLITHWVQLRSDPKS